MRSGECGVRRIEPRPTTPHSARRTPHWLHEPPRPRPRAARQRRPARKRRPGGRSVGSVVATATAGPLRQGFGPVRDHLLGVTFVTGDGRIVQSGGRVVKNVAGYDLTKLEAGGFGAFGVIVLVHLRLRALPRVDQTLVLEGSRDDLTQVADDIAAAGLPPAAPHLPAAPPPPGGASGVSVLVPGPAA